MIRNKKTKTSPRPKGLRGQALNAKPSRKMAPVSNARKSYVVASPKLSQGTDSVSITHREYICDVPGSILFNALGFPVNAGRDTCFNWLSTIAMRYERYQFERLRFIYEPRCSTATAGSVILAVDYDPLDASPVTKQDVYAYSHSAQSSAWDECCFTVDPAVLRSRGTLYSRVGQNPAGSDLKTYDLGNLWLCRSGFAGTDVCGELFVEYSVRLTIPQVSKTTQSWYGAASAGLAAGSLFGTTIALGSSNSLDLTVTSASTVTLSQNWEGLITMVVTGTGLAAGGFASSGTTLVQMLSETYNAGSTSGTVILSVPSGLRGGTIILALTATTVTANTIRFSPF